ncbi:hypothetical protein B0H14DRAFT_2790960 [Mycena olivaceomarginata]|nr:hypothetical protein B0H14DRAFT_2790960 [Mycena olivaceomarginata]
MAHERRPSLDTNASGLSLGVSAMSSLRPPPPYPLPQSPHTSRALPRALHFLPPHHHWCRAGLGDRSPVSPLSQAGGTPSSSRDVDSLSNISPYDWHEGASSIDVDATEHSLLSTSFITSLLRGENPEQAASHRTSLRSDFSEMTYPPPRTHTATRQPPAQRPVGARPPPSSFQPIPEAAPVSDDDSTLYSVQDPVVRTASVSRGMPVVGVASATLRNMKGISEAPSYGKIDLDYAPQSSVPFSPAVPSSGGTQRRFLPETSPETRQSTYSTKSHVPSFVSASSRSIRRMFTWRKKPLPPVPKIAHIPVAAEAEFKRKEEATPLDQLLMRSDALRSALDTGQHPHNSFVSRNPGLVSSFDEHSMTPAIPKWNNNNPNPDWSSGPQTNEKKSRTSTLMKKRRIWVIMCVFVAVALAAVGVAVGVTMHSRNTKGKGTTCGGNLVGAACNLVTLAPQMNTLFGTNFTLNEVYIWIWTQMGTITAKNCAAQAVLVDVGASVALTNFPNRTTWAQAALLFDLQSLNNTDLQNFVVNAPWALMTVDGPAHVSNASLFTTVASGYQYDFAGQNITVPSVSFATDGAPTQAQAAQVASTAPLDRMYSFAAAASTQYLGLLQAYWVTNLQLTLDKLPLFMASLRSAPIVIPFNVETGSVRTQMTSSANFPLPIACYPGLAASQLQQINALEGVFGLSPTTSSATQFDSTCFPTRPVYGVLDVLRLRLPFADSRTSVARQAVALKPDVRPRAVVYSGEVVSAFPGIANSTGSVSLNPNDYGTIGHFNHVVLQYLSSMPSGVARTVADFPLLLYPALEVAVFGTLTKADLDFVSSGFADSAGGLVFGSSEGNTLRQWAIPATSNLVWTEFANSSLVVHDTSFTDLTFNQTWAAAAGLANVTVSNITTSFQETGKFSP